MLDVVRWIWAALWALFFFGNWLTNVATLVRRRGSMIVLFGGVAGVVSLAIAPVPISPWLWPVPLLVDPGSSLVVLAFLVDRVRTE